MFGTFRFALALLVVWYHLVDREFAGPVAVFGFYCLSGFLMTQAVNGPYADGIAGFGRYLANRALRLYPAYWTALAAGALAVAAIPGAALAVSRNFTWPESALSDLLIVGHLPLTLSLAPVAWSLSVEIVFYVLIGAGLARFRLAALLWLVFSLQLVLFGAVWRGFPPSWFQFSLPAASLAFATGAALWHARERLAALPAWCGPAFAALALGAALLMPREFGRAGGLHLSLVATALAVAGLAAWRRRAWDDALGDLAYPVFLLHYPCAALAIRLTGAEAWPADLLTVGLTLAASWATVRGVERPVARMRDRLRRVPADQLAIANTVRPAPAPARSIDAQS